MPAQISFGLTCIPPFPPESLADFARQAESAGFDSVWIYEDCFYGGAFASAATLLSATQRIRVGVGILPATVRNPLFAAMEIATLARLYPGRFVPGFGHGWIPWMKQIGATPRSTLQALEETVQAVRALLSGQEVTLQGSHVHLKQVRQLLLPAQVPPLYIGAFREKTLRLAGRIGDGTLLSVLSSPAYVRWADAHISAGVAESGRDQHERVVSVICKIDPDGAAARRPVRRWLAESIQRGGPHLIPLGIDADARTFFNRYGLEDGARQMPEAWVDELSASGTPDHAFETVQRLIEAGATEVVLTPAEPDPARFQDTIRYFKPFLK